MTSYVAEALDTNTFPMGMQFANADFIVRACNSHYELLEALETLIADFGDYPASERPCLAFDNARAAIAKARNGE